MKRNNQRKESVLACQRGMATIEVIPILVIFVVLISYAMGYFGIIHSAILNSIAARTYAFETFRNRTNLMYFRENRSTADSYVAASYRTHEVRYHTVLSERGLGDEDGEFLATSRPISWGVTSGDLKGKPDDHNTKIFTIGGGGGSRNGEGGPEVNPAWIQVGYGMCLNANCGD